MKNEGSSQFCGINIYLGEGGRMYYLHNRGKSSSFYIVIFISCLFFTCFTTISSISNASLFVFISLVWLYFPLNIYTQLKHTFIVNCFFDLVFNFIHIIRFKGENGNKSYQWWWSCMRGRSRHHNKKKTMIFRKLFP